jgi:S-DNA-T family DNA segregation ATPase FtsK/SpoIIIE
VDVITGLIKSNLPARIAFQVASRTDSRVVLDEMGADKLLGNGDMLFLWPGTSTLLRGQGAYVSDDEIARVVNFAGQHEPQFVSELIQLKPAAQDGPQGRGRHDDDLFEAAVDIVIREGRGSVSLLQRSLGIGYGRAARLIDYMAEDGIVGQYNGSQAREVLVSMEGWRQMMGEDNGAKPADAAAVRSRLPARDVMTSTRDEPRRPAVPARPARLAADWSDEDQEDNEDDVLAEDDLEEETNDVIEQDVEDVDDSVDEQSDDEPSIAPWEPRRGEAESRRRRRPSA